MTNKSDVATLEGVRIEALRYGVTATPEEEEINFTSIKGKAADSDEAVYLVYYNEAALNVTRDLRAVLKSKGHDTPEFPVEHGPESNQMVSDLSDKGLNISVVDAKVRKSPSGVVIYKGGEFEVDLTDVPLLKEARDKVAGAEKALADMKSAYADVAEKIFAGVVIEAEEKEAEVEDAPLPTDEEVTHTGEADAPEVGANADEPEETADADATEAKEASVPEVAEEPKPEPEPEVEVAEESEAPAEDEKPSEEVSEETVEDEAKNEDEVRFGDEPDDGVAAKEVNLNLEGDGNTKPAKEAEEKAEDETPKPEAETSPKEEESKPAAAPKKAERPKPRLKLSPGRRGTSSSGPRM